MGEVGQAHFDLLSENNNDVRGYDIDASKCRNMDKFNKIIEHPGDNVDALIIAIRYRDDFVQTAKDYVARYWPKLIINCSTVPPGTTERISELAVHSTTRGLHPNLKQGLLSITKHIGGPRTQAIEAATLFESVGIKCEVHNTAKTTELAHILNNVAYGISLMAADEFQRICRHYGVDYYQAVMKYTETNNEGYRRLGNDSKVRPILTPPNGHIGGHCVVQSAALLAESLSGGPVDLLRDYNTEHSNRPILKIISDARVPMNTFILKQEKQNGKAKTFTES